MIDKYDTATFWKTNKCLLLTLMVLQLSICFLKSDEKLGQHTCCRNCNDKQEIEIWNVTDRIVHKTAGEQCSYEVATTAGARGGGAHAHGALKNRFLTRSIMANWKIVVQTNSYFWKAMKNNNNYHIGIRRRNTFSTIFIYRSKHVTKLKTMRSVKKKRISKRSNEKICLVE